MMLSWLCLLFLLRVSLCAFIDVCCDSCHDVTYSIISTINNHDKQHTRQRDTHSLSCLGATQEQHVIQAKMVLDETTHSTLLGVGGRRPVGRSKYGKPRLNHATCFIKAGGCKRVTVKEHRKRKQETTNNAKS